MTQAKVRDKRYMESARQWKIDGFVRDVGLSYQDTRLIVDLGEPSFLSHAERLVMRRRSSLLWACTYTATRGSLQ